MSSPDEMRQRLNENIPRDVIAQREGGGRKLSYLEGWYVIARLNEVLGQGNWSYFTEEMNCVAQGDNGNGGFTAHYIAKIRLEVPALGCIFSDYGYGDGSDKKLPGKAHELAVKEAVTDGIKRCAKNLGMSMGLALYDKSQEFVDDGQDNAGGNSREVPNHGTGRSNKEASAAVGQGPKRPGPVGKAAPVEKEVPASSDSEAPEVEETRDQLNALIGTMAKVVIAKKRKTLPELKADMKAKYGVESKEELGDPQAREFYNSLKEMTA